jgi:2-polyprenyl-3-methyl-5-hydroxy-6-metoxy-1,4-benzoquinol methylase
MAQAARRLTDPDLRQDGLMTDSWDEYAAGWDDDPGARAYATAAYKSLVSALEERGPKLLGAGVLDFGCGTGLLTEQLVGQVASIDAVDTSAAMLEVLRAKARAHGWTGVEPLGELELAAGPYDLIVCSSVCSFLDDYPATAADLARRLTPGGVFVQWDWERDDNDDDPHGLTREGISDALTAAGLDAVAVDIGFEAEFESMTMRPLMGIGSAPSRAN